jgi:uncharacterized protein (DUF2147 family)
MRVSRYSELSMSRWKLLPAVALAALLPAIAPAAPAPPDIAGHYRAPGGAIIAISACAGGQVCGRIAGLGDLPAADANNPTLEMQTRPLCGASVIDRLAWANGSWRGVLYDPHNGTNYNVALTPAHNGAVRVVGHTTQPFLGRTYSRALEVWDRVPAPSTPCNAPPATS